MSDRFRGALLGVAIGDALGAPLEGRPGRERASLRSWVAEPPEPLRYTDDTHMTLATARSLVVCRGFRGEHMAESLASQYEREPWRGYGPGPPQVFRRLRQGRAWNEAARDLFGGSGSFGNGAAMRVAPIGLAYHRNPELASSIARDAARITHSHPAGKDGAAVQAAAVAEILQPGEGEPGALLPRIERHARTRWLREPLARMASLAGAPLETVVEVLGNGIEAHRSVPAALHSFLRHRDSFTDAVLYALSLGGDTDTIASMTGALAGASLGESAIPAAWARRVEGRGELLELAGGLLELSAVSG